MRFVSRLDGDSVIALQAAHCAGLSRSPVCVWVSLRRLGFGTAPDEGGASNAGVVRPAPSANEFFSLALKALPMGPLVSRRS